MLTSNNHRARLALAVSFGVTLLLLSVYLVDSYGHLGPSRIAASTLAVANSTLGFGGVYVVAQNGSRSLPAMMSAANASGIVLQSLTPSVWNERDVLRIVRPVSCITSRTAARTWLGHRATLQTFLQTGQATALILDDALRWSRTIRQHELPSIARSIRNDISNLAPTESYYGNLSAWDIIWLGHCGTSFTPSLLSSIHALEWFEESIAVDSSTTYPWLPATLRARATRFLAQQTTGSPARPLCAFAYAVTRAAAEKITADIIVQAPICDVEHLHIAYEIRLLTACQDGTLQCITVSPEPFQQFDATPSAMSQLSGLGIVNEEKLPPSQGVRFEMPEDHPDNTYSYLAHDDASEL